MASLSRTAQAQLAKEIEANRPAPEWDSIVELKKFRESITLKDGSKKSMTFEQMVDTYKDLDAEIKFRESRQKELKTAIYAAMLLSGEQEVVCNTYPVQVISKAGSKKVDPQKLLENGVSADVIAKCTVQGAGSTYVQIGKPKKD